MTAPLRKTPPVHRLDEIIAKLEPRLRRVFMAAVANMRSATSLAELARLIEAGQIEDALVLVGRHLGLVADASGVGFSAAAQSTASYVAQRTGVFVSFDGTNTRAVATMRTARLRLIREFTDGQRDAVRVALTESLSRGANPRRAARAFRESIGLTAHQESAVWNYRRLLETRSRGALDRMLRDRRFDRSVEAAVRGDRVLKPAQIDRMVERYRERMLSHRAETIARTESLRAAHEGAEEALQQAVEQGELAPDEVIRRWVTARDHRVRHSHRSMNGQTRPLGVPFDSGNGFQLRYPTDPQAPASETIRCRCVLTTRLT